MSKAKQMDRSWPAGVPSDSEPPLPPVETGIAKPDEAIEAPKYEPRPRLRDWTIRGFGFALVSVLLFALLVARASAFEPKLPASNLRGMNTVAVVVDVDDETSNFLGKHEVDQRFKKLLAELGIKTVPLRHGKMVIKIQVRSVVMPLPGNEARSHMAMLSVYQRLKKEKATVCIWHHAVMMPSALTDFNDNLDSTRKAIDVVVDGAFDDFSTNWKSVSGNDFRRR